MSVAVRQAFTTTANARVLTDALKAANEREETRGRRVRLALAERHLRRLLGHRPQVTLLAYWNHDALRFYFLLRRLGWEVRAATPDAEDVEACDWLLVLTPRKRVSDRTRE